MPNTLRLVVILICIGAFGAYSQHLGEAGLIGGFFAFCLNILIAFVGLVGRYKVFWAVYMAASIISAGALNTVTPLGVLVNWLQRLA
jgi:hypothetical protein